VTDLEPSNSDPSATAGSMASLGSPAASKPAGQLGSLLSVTTLLGMLGGLVATLFFYWVNIEASAVPVQPRHVPVAVVGPSPVAGQVEARLESGGAFNALVARSEAEAVTFVRHRRADAIVNLYTHELQTAPAASTLTPTILEQVFLSPGAPADLRTVVIVPLAAGDPQGMGLMLFLPLACVLGGLPAGVALAILSKPRRPVSLGHAGQRTVLIIVNSTLIALGLALLADWILGYGGSQMFTIWGWATFLVTACMACAEAFVAAFGIPGVLLAAIPLLFFGGPGIPWPAPWNWQSAVFRDLGPYDAVGAASDGFRNGIFFSDADPTKDLAVLAVWTLVPLLLLLALGWQGQLKSRHQRTVLPGRSEERGARLEEGARGTSSASPAVTSSATSSTTQAHHRPAVSRPPPVLAAFLVLARATAVRLLIPAAQRVHKDRPRRNDINERLDYSGAYRARR